MADSTESSEFYDKTLEAVTAASLLTEENGSIDLRRRFERDKYEIEKNLNYVHIYSEYQRTLLEALEENESLPEVIEIAEDKSSIRDEMIRTSHRIASRWDQVDDSYRRINQLFRRAEEDWQDYLENELFEKKFLDFYNLESVDEYPELIEKVGETEDRIASTGEEVSQIAKEIPADLTEPLPEDLSIEKIRVY